MKHKSKDLRLVTPMIDFQVGLGLCEIVFFFVLSLSQINTSAVPKFISSVLYEGLRTVGLQMDQFNFPRVLITLFKQGKEHSVRDSKGNRQLERGGGGILITYDL